MRGRSTLPRSGDLAPCSHREPTPALAAITPSEGWTTVILLAMVVLSTVWTVGRANTVADPASLGALAMGGLLTGLVLAKRVALDLVAHLVAMLGGFAASVLLVAMRMPLVSSGPLDRVRALADRASEWLAQAQGGARLDDPRLVALALGMAAWLTAHTSAWTLFRRGWPTVALVLPAGITLAHLGRGSAENTAPLVVTVAAGVMLAAQHATFRHELAWSRARLSYPVRLTRSFWREGVVFALLVGGLAWLLPHSVHAGLNTVSERAGRPVDAVATRWNALVARFGEPDTTSGAYSAFGTSFRLGGRLALSDDPVILVRTAGGSAAPYLVGQRYDAYDGRGWSTTVEETFRPNGPEGQRYAPRVSFARGQGIHLSPAVTTGRSQVEASLTVMRPKGNVLFTRDTYLTADRRTTIELSWLQLANQPYSLASDDLASLPIDLRRLGVLLSRGAYLPSPDSSANTDSPLPRDPTLASEIQQEREALSGRFLDARWEVGPDGRAKTLFASGQLPVYDDVAAVFNQEPVASGEAYTVTGLTSIASPDQLRAAGTDYPGWVRDRYLDLPDTVTPRTRQLASRLASRHSNPFDVAVAVETFVRSTIAYNQEIDAPPEDQDVVDYVLFDSRQGYCVYYASAMAVLLRAEGIPARVVGGYYPAPFDPSAGGFLYREKNAHLWVETFFPGYGWIPFEPTANREPLRYGAAAPPIGTPVVSTPAPIPPVPAVAATPPPVADAPARQSPPPAGPSRLGRIAAGIGLVAAGFVAAAAVAIGAWLRAFRGLSPAAGLFARAMRVGAWLGIRPSASLTPREYADRVGRVVPAARRPVRVVADLYAQERYGKNPPSEASIRTARAAWRQLRTTAAARALRRRGARR